MWDNINNNRKRKLYNFEIKSIQGKQKQRDNSVDIFTFHAAAQPPPTFEARKARNKKEPGEKVQRRVR